MRNKLYSIIAGITAGTINGLLGAGGGMVLVPLLEAGGELEEREIFSSSLVIIGPMCIVSLLVSSGGSLPWSVAWPYLLGALPGGLLAGLISRRIPTTWLHRVLGILILYGGVRYLC